MQKPIKYTQTSGVAAAVGVTSIIDASLVSGGSTIDKSVSFLLVQCETQNVRWRDDGTAPTASVGMLLKTGQHLIVERGRFANWQVIETAASAKLNVTAYSGDPFCVLPPG